MSNVLTRKEIIEYVGSTLLTFSCYTIDRFVFSGTTKDNCFIMIFVKPEEMYLVSNNCTLDPSVLSKCTSKTVNYLILNRDLEIIYRD